MPASSGRQRDGVGKDRDVALHQQAQQSKGKGGDVAAA